MSGSHFVYERDPNKIEADPTHRSSKSKTEASLKVFLPLNFFLSQLAKINK